MTPCAEEMTDLLAAFLADIGFESFVPNENGLVAYIRKEIFSEDSVRDVITDFPYNTNISFTSAIVEGQDWNEEWEKNYFKPIVISDRCVVHSSFHKDVPQAEYDIVIDPKMAFGTGHHSTTNLMISYLIDLPLRGRRVYDVGTGTAILAILAAMRGASYVCGIEIDAPAWENARDNISLNNVEVDVILGDASNLPDSPDADLLIANINRNIIINDLKTYSRSLKSGGTMLLSGFYEIDIPVIMDVASPLGLRLVETRIDKEWTALRLEKE